MYRTTRRFLEDRKAGSRLRVFAVVVQWNFEGESLGARFLFVTSFESRAEKFTSEEKMISMFFLKTIQGMEFDVKFGLNRHGMSRAWLG